MVKHAKVKLGLLLTLLLTIVFMPRVGYRQPVLLVPERTALASSHGSKTEGDMLTREMPPLSSPQPPQFSPSPEVSTEKRPPKLPSVGQRKPAGGHVLVNRYWEQLTCASRNLLLLQCWARRLNMLVVEPVITGGSYFGTFYTKEPQLRFSDIFDIDHWNAGRFMTGLVPWEQFLRTASRNLILVNINYTYKPGEGGRDYCASSSFPLATFLEVKGFKTVRQVCISFTETTWLKLRDFNRRIFGAYRPSDATVLFGEWRGLGKYRVQVLDMGCTWLFRMVYTKLKPSPRVVRDAESYAATYLKTSGYVAVMVRMEKAGRIVQNVTSCFEPTLKKWDKMVKNSGINSTFLSADMGRFGSASFKSAAKNLDEEFQNFFTRIYGQHLTVSQWESTFQAVSGVSDAAYISVLQKALAARAKCLLLVGGGSFQQHALQLYLNRHPPEKRCVHIVERCTTQLDVKALT